MTILSNVSEMKLNTRSWSPIWRCLISFKLLSISSLCSSNHSQEYDSTALFVVTNAIWVSYAVRCQGPNPKATESDLWGMNKAASGPGSSTVAPAKKKTNKLKAKNPREHRKQDFKNVWLDVTWGQQPQALPSRRVIWCCLCSGLST